MLTGYETRTWEWKTERTIDGLDAFITLSNTFTVSMKINVKHFGTQTQLTHSHSDMHTEANFNTHARSQTNTHFLHTAVHISSFLQSFLKGLHFNPPCSGTKLL